MNKLSIKRILLILVVILLINNISFAQQEVYISSNKERVESLHGFQLGLAGLAEFNSITSYNLKCSGAYFYEWAIVHPISVVFSGSLSSYYRQASGIVIPMFNNLDIYLQAEPRYYFSLAHRVSTDRGGLNSGWFAALPLSLSTPLVFAKTYRLNGKVQRSSGYDGGIIISYGAGLNVGYRYAASNNIFIEGMLGGYYQSYGASTGYFYITTGLKVGYAF